MRADTVERLPKLSAGAVVTVGADGVRAVHYRTTVDPALCACCERPHVAGVVVDGRAYDLCMVHALRLARRTGARLVMLDETSRSWVQGPFGRIQPCEIRTAFGNGGWGWM